MWKMHQSNLNQFATLFTFTPKRSEKECQRKSSHHWFVDKFSTLYKSSREEDGRGKKWNYVSDANRLWLPTKHVQTADVRSSTPQSDKERRDQNRSRFEDQQHPHWMCFTIRNSSAKMELKSINKKLFAFENRFSGFCHLMLLLILSANVSMRGR